MIPAFSGWEERFITTKSDVSTTPSSWCFDDALVGEGACKNGRILMCRAALDRRGGVAELPFGLSCLRERMLPGRSCAPSATRAWPIAVPRGRGRYRRHRRCSGSHTDPISAPQCRCIILLRMAPKPPGMTPHA